jgi:hypothetical protein
VENRLIIPRLEPIRITRTLALHDHLIVKDKERIHPHAGRLDLLCQNEIQRGLVNEDEEVQAAIEWKELVTFDIVPVRTSVKAAESIAAQS